MPLNEETKPNRHKETQEIMKDEEDGFKSKFPVCNFFLSTTDSTIHDSNAKVDLKMQNKSQL